MVLQPKRLQKYLNRDYLTLPDSDKILLGEFFVFLFLLKKEKYSQLKLLFRIQWWFFFQKNSHATLFNVNLPHLRHFSSAKKNLKNDRFWLKWVFLKFFKTEKNLKKLFFSLNIFKLANLQSNIISKPDGCQSHNAIIDWVEVRPVFVMREYSRSTEYYQKS